MRNLVFLGAALIASALVAGDVAGQAPKDYKVRPQGTVVIPGVSKPLDAADRSRISALSETGCGMMGGEVIGGDQIASLCASGKYCRVFDQEGKAHRMCIAASS